MAHSKLINSEDLFSSEIHSITFAPEALLLKNFALKYDAAILKELEQIFVQSPLRHMTTPNGYTMSVAMTNCGSLGWITDRSGYRYSRIDPLTQKKWPVMPELFKRLAIDAALAAGFPGFNPEVCLINQYTPGSKLSLHQDKDELNFKAPIVSVSLGLPATFVFGGLQRTDKVQKIALDHGDVVVWGGVSRLNYHAIPPLKAGVHPLFGEQRINLTFRQVYIETDFTHA